MGWRWRRGGPLTFLTVAIHLLTVGAAQAGTLAVRADYYRWRHDDGGETGATWIASTNTPCLDYTGGVIRVRFSVAQQAYFEPTQYGLICSTSKAPLSTNEYYTVPAVATMESFEMAASPWFSNGDRTTSQLPGGTSAFRWTPGYVVEAPTNWTGDMDFGEPGGNTTYYSNFEFCIRATSNALPGTTYYFVPKCSDGWLKFTDPGVAELRTPDFPGDVNKDRVINAEDLNIVVTNFGKRYNLAAP
jgi:hypothetical protein